MCAPRHPAKYEKTPLPRKGLPKAGRPAGPDFHRDSYLGFDLPSSFSEAQYWTTRWLFQRIIRILTTARTANPAAAIARGASRTVTAMMTPKATINSR